VSLADVSSEDKHCCWRLTGLPQDARRRTADAKRVTGFSVIIRYSFTDAKMQTISGIFFPFVSNPCLYVFSRNLFVQKSSYMFKNTP
jgi:hypothetical protein